MVREEDTLTGWRGSGGSIVWKTPDTALYSIYVSTLCLLLYVASGPVIYPPDQVGTKLKLYSEKDQSFKRALSGKVGENVFYTYFIRTANSLILSIF